jgi:hypothetical protein
MAKNPLRAVKGELPKKRDVVDWPEEKILQLLRFVQPFIVDEKFKCTIEARKTAELRAQDEPYWPEFLIRIDKPVGGEGASEMQFRMRMMNMLRQVLAFVKQYPHVVTETMLPILQSTTRFSWCLHNFAAKETKLGAEIVVMQNRDTTDPSIANPKPDLTKVATPQIRFNKSLMESVGVMEMLLRGIKQKDINAMGTKDRIKTATALAATLTKTFSQYKPNVQVFQQINVSQAEREDLERVMFEYQEAQEIDAE